VDGPLGSARLLLPVHPFMPFLSEGVSTSRQAFAVLLPIRTVGVMGDFRIYVWVGRGRKARGRRARLHQVGPSGVRLRWFPADSQQDGNTSSSNLRGSAPTDRCRRSWTGGLMVLKYEA
jgi:hypothetical protein